MIWMLIIGSEASKITSKQPENLTLHVLHFKMKISQPMAILIWHLASRTPIYSPCKILADFCMPSRPKCHYSINSTNKTSTRGNWKEIQIVHETVVSYPCNLHLMVFLDTVFKCKCIPWWCLKCRTCKHLVFRLKHFLQVTCYQLDQESLGEDWFYWSHCKKMHCFVKEDACKV